MSDWSTPGRPYAGEPSEGAATSWPRVPARPGSGTTDRWPQGPTLRGRAFASGTRRAGGFGIDWLLMLIPPTLLFIAWNASVTPAQYASGNGYSAISSTLVVAALLSVPVVFVGYPVWFIGRSGQTPGMRLMRIRLYRIDSDGSLSAPGYGTAWRRVAYALSATIIWPWGLVDYLSGPWNKHRQCLHDRFAGTVALDQRA